jgi:hypothetical protein
MSLVSRNFFKNFLKGKYFIFGIDPPFLGKGMYKTGGYPRKDRRRGAARKWIRGY